MAIIRAHPRFLAVPHPDDKEFPWRVWDDTHNRYVSLAKNRQEAENTVTWLLETEA
jgi:hypothetical protein